MKAARLAFSGSGFLAGIHAGAACALMDAGFQIVEVAGTSGGSIVAAAVALGMSRDQLHDLAVKEPMAGLLEFNFGALFHGAYCDGEALLAWLERQFGRALLHDVRMPLQIICTDVEGGGAYTFDQTMGVSLALACRASSAVPFIYEPVRFNGHSLIDGGVTNNIPVDRLKHDGALRIGVDVEEPARYRAAPLLAYAGTLIKLLLAGNENNLMHLEASTGATIVSVPAGSAGFLDTHLTTEAKQALFDAGYHYMLDRVTSISD